MPRALNSGMNTAITSPTGERCELVEMQFEDQSNVATPVYLTDAAQDIVWNGITWQAIGGRLDIGDLGEDGESSAPGLRLRLPGVDQAVLAVIMASRYLGRLVKVFYAALDPAGGAIVDAPIEMFRGRMDGGFNINESRGDFGSGTVDIDCRVISGFDEFDQTSGVQTNVTSHQATIPGASTDTYFQHVPGLGRKQVYWGMKTPGGTGARPSPPPTGGGLVNPPGGNRGGGLVNPPGTTSWGSKQNPWGL